MNYIQEDDSRPLVGKFIGVPYKSGGRQLEDGGLDCWGLVVCVLNERGAKLNTYPEIPPDDFRGILCAILKETKTWNWHPTEYPVDYTVVLLGRSPTATPLHAGVIFRCRTKLYVLHSKPNFGVVLESLTQINSQYRHRRFYNYERIKVQQSV
jgi:hypothetical protein